MATSLVSGPVSPSPRAWSPLRDRRFWLAQLVAWIVVHALYFGDRILIAFALGMPWTESARLCAVSLAATVPASALLAEAFVRAGPRATDDLGRYALTRALPLALSAALPCSLAMHGAFAWIGRPPTYGGVMPIPLTLDYLGLMVGYSAGFILLVLKGRLRETRERLLVNESLAHQAHLAALRARIHPHFLFNSLNSVIALVSREPERARQMLRDVSELLRSSLASARSEGAMLRDELAFQRSYLRCEETRFSRRLQARVEADASLDREPVPSMLLQPLVENAIKHGMRPGHPLTVVVRATKEAGVLTLEVRNSGALAERGESPETGGTGLRLVRDRLAARYPESGRFELFAEAGWVVARIRYDPREAELSGAAPPELRLAG